MLRYSKFLPLVAIALVGAAILGAPAQARAEFRLSLQEAGVNGGAITQVATGGDFTPLQFSGTYGDFSVTFFGATSTNGASLSDIMSSTTTIVNLNGSSRTLTMYVSQTNFTLPTGPKLNVESGQSGTLTSGTVVLANQFQAYADAGNSINGIGGFTNGAQTATQTGSTFDTGSANGLFTRGSGSYSLTTVSTLNLSGGAILNLSNHENVTPVPVPAGVVLAISGLPFLGIGAWLRRRKVKVQVS